MDIFSNTDLTAIYAISATLPFIRPILQELIKGSFEQTVATFTADALKELLNTNDWKKAVAKSFKAFLEQFKNALDKTGISNRECNVFYESLRTFISDNSVRTELGSVFINNQAVIFSRLAKAWKTLGLVTLPDDFNWLDLTLHYKAAVAKIIEDDKIIREIISIRSIQVTARGIQRSSGIDPGFNLSLYANALLIRYGYLKDNCLCPKEDSCTIKLTKIFIEQSVRSFQQFNLPVYEITWERRNALRIKEKILQEEFVEDQVARERKLFFQQQTLPVLEVINKLQRNQRLIVILGDPGSGKSVLLNHLAVQWAELSTLDRAVQPVPLLIELKSYVRNLQEGHCRNFLEYLDHAPSCVAQLNQDDLEQVLQQGDAIFLLDGLDEVFEHHLRQQIANELVRFSVRYPLVQFVITSRIIGYEVIAQILRNASFRHYMLQELDVEQQESFLMKWHDLAYSDPQERKVKYDRLRTAIRDITIRELAENPLLLTLMAVLNKYQELPKDRNDLYKQASRVMLHQWDTEKALYSSQIQYHQTIHYDDKHAMLRAVALKMQTSSMGLSGNIIAGQEIENIFCEYLDSRLYEAPRLLARSLLEQLRERNNLICMVGDSYYAFIHRTFLEFFCASAWVFKYKEGEQGYRYTFEELEKETFEKYWENEKWHEVLRLIIAQIDPHKAAELIMRLIHKHDSTNRFQNIFLAASCFSVLRLSKPLNELALRLEQELSSLVRFDLPYYYAPWEDESLIVAEIRKAAIRAKALCWPRLEKTKSWLIKQVQKNDNSSVQQAAIQEIARGWKDDPDTLLWLKKLSQIDDNWAASHAAILELARGWKDDPETLIILKKKAQKDDNWAVQQGALQELAYGWKGDPDTLIILKNQAEKNVEKNVRWAAIREVARGWKNDPATVLWIKEQAQTNDNLSARQAAVREFARGWKDDPDTLIWLKKQIHDNTYAAVRQAAVRELARGWREDSETLKILINRLGDLDGQVRQTTLQELARGWKNDPGTLSILKNQAQNNEKMDTQNIALQELVRGWKDDQDTLSLLKRQVTNDRNFAIRQTAVRELAHGWRDDSETQTILMHSAQCDDVPSVREVALQELGRGWNDDHDVRAILMKSVQQDQNWDVRQVALQELARGWKADPDTLSWLQQRAQGDQNWDVRQAAVQAIARGWKADPATLSWLKEKARNDDHWAVQQVAVYEIARGWKDDPDTLSWLQDNAYNSKYWSIQQAALQELLRGWKDDPETLKVLKHKARNAEHSAVKQVALQKLAQGWKNDPETLTILKDIAQFENHWETRKLAYEELWRGWKGDNTTLGWIKIQNESNDTLIVQKNLILELQQGLKSKDKLSWLQHQARHADSWAVQQAAIRELSNLWNIDL